VGASAARRLLVAAGGRAVGGRHEAEAPGLVAGQARVRCTHSRVCRVSPPLPPLGTCVRLTVSCCARRQSALTMPSGCCSSVSDCASQYKQSGEKTL
jgi:hypothetical protein